MLNDSRARARGRRKVWARNARASCCSEKRRARSCRSTTGSVARRNKKGKPTRPFCPTNSAWVRRPSLLTSVLNKSAVINGMSHERKRMASPGLVARAVKTPPTGPQRGMRSRRMTRCGMPDLRAVPRTWPRSVRCPRSRDTLFRPIRELAPPARMQISTGSSCGAGSPTNVRVFKGLVRTQLRPTGAGTKENRNCGPGCFVLRRSGRLWSGTKNETT